MSGAFAGADTTLPPEAQVRVECDVTAILDALRASGHQLDAVVLSGSLGRGEGTVLAQGGKLVLLSDYDIFLVSEDAADRAIFRPIEASLAPRVWGHHVSFGTLRTSALPALPPALWTYDLRYGSRVLQGDPALLERIPAYSASTIPPWEAVKLVCNYMGVLLDALAPDVLSPGEEGTLSLRLAMVTLATRLGDALAIQEGRYQPQLARRREILPTLRAFCRLDAEGQAVVAWGYDEKCAPRDLTSFSVAALLPRLLHTAHTVLQHVAGAWLGSAGDVPGLLMRYRRRCGPPSGLGSRLARMCRRMQPQGYSEQYHEILAAVPLVLLACPALDSPLPMSRIGPWRGTGTSRQEREPLTWAAAREIVLQRWKAICL